jgi:hypothetical protein
MASTRFPAVPPPYARVLDDWRRGRDHESAAVGENLALDHRISPERDLDFFHRMGSPASATAMSRALGDYHRKVVRPAPAESFLNSVVNGNNFVGGAAIEGLVADLDLAVIVWLNGLVRPLSRAYAADPSLFSDFPIDADAEREGEEVTSWFDRHLDKSREADEDFVGRILRGLRAAGGPRHNPCWATTWARFEKVSGSDPERWLELVGVPRFAPGWVIVFKYHAREVGTLVRPTQFDAGWNGYHFPSPPPHPRDSGGVVVDLAPAPWAGLTPEFIHEQIEWRMPHWTAGGRLVKRTIRAVNPPLARARNSHWDALTRHFGPGVRTWQDGNC